MSARVCNPVALTEIAKLRSPDVIRKPLIARVKRDLFGPVDKQESKNFIDRQLAAQNEALSKKWGFDFNTGEPLQNHDQYQWERVPPTSAPDYFTGMVTITRVAHIVSQSSTTSEDLLDQRAERENGNLYRHQLSISGSESESDASFETVRTLPLVLRSETIAAIATATTTTTATSTSSNTSSFPATANRAKRQQRITDYLKERKRLSTGSPKPTAAKKARQMLSSSAPSAGVLPSSSSSAAACPQGPPVDQ